MEMGNIEVRCEDLLKADLPETVPDGYSIQRLTGDASSRSYFRIQLRGDESVVLMRMPEPFDESNFPYLENYHLFRSSGIRLAEVYSMDPSRGLVLLQDLGDNTLYELYEAWTPLERLTQYLRALDYLRTIESIQPAGTLAFDTEKLLWELNFFQEHFLKGLKHISLSDTESQEMQEHFRRLASELANRPRKFCHRDYHARNLMVLNADMYVIDFQDARLGPVTYDVASLCYDSYIHHSPDFLSHLESYFFTYHPDGEIQRYEYPRMCLQRNLKALGTFGYQASKLGRDFYLQFVDSTLSYVQRHFDKLPEYAEFQKLLGRYFW